MIPKRQWPVVVFGEKRAITAEEHHLNVDRETNPERKAFYQLAWHLGASQSDVAHLQAENESAYHPAFNIHLARTYLSAVDLTVSKRNWQDMLGTDFVGSRRSQHPHCPHYLSGSRSGVLPFFPEEEWSQRTTSQTRPG